MHENKTVLVTGGAGFIGSHTAVELIQSGYDVIIVDNLSNSDFSAIEGIEAITEKKINFENIDCCDRNALEHVFKKYEFDSVIHFAAYKAVGESVSEPLKYYNNNINSMISVLELMKQYGIPNIVFSSSATVYGQPEILPATENSPLQKASSPYGQTKQICEDIIESTVKSTDSLNAISLRYFNPIGAHPTALLGELPKGVPNNLVPFITQTAAGLRDCISVFGHDYNTPDGSALRDYIDITDLGKAHVSTLDRLIGRKNKSRYEIFNIGTGKATSVLELIHEFEKANNLTVKYKLTDRRQGDVEEVWASTELANSELGWKAERTLAETLRSAWEWEKRIRKID